MPYRNEFSLIKAYRNFSTPRVRLMIEIIQNVGIRPKFSYINVPGFADVGSVQHEHDYVPQTLK